MKNMTIQNRNLYSRGFVIGQQPVAQFLPDELKSSLPTIEEIEAELNGDTHSNGGKE